MDERKESTNSYKTKKRGKKVNETKRFVKRDSSRKHRNDSRQRAGTNKLIPYSVSAVSSSDIVGYEESPSSKRKPSTVASGYYNNMRTKLAEEISDSDDALSGAEKLILGGFGESCESLLKTIKQPKSPLHSDVSDASNVSYASKVSDASEVSDTSKVSDASNVSDASEVSDASKGGRGGSTDSEDHGNKNVQHLPYRKIRKFISCDLKCPKNKLNSAMRNVRSTKVYKQKFTSYNKKKYTETLNNHNCTKKNRKTGGAELQSRATSSISSISNISWNNSYTSSSSSIEVNHEKIFQSITKERHRGGQEKGIENNNCEQKNNGIRRSVGNNYFNKVSTLKKSHSDVPKIITKKNLKMNKKQARETSDESTVATMSVNQFNKSKIFSHFDKSLKGFIKIGLPQGTAQQNIDARTNIVLEDKSQKKTPLMLKNDNGKENENSISIDKQNNLKKSNFNANENEVKSINEHKMEKNEIVLQEMIPKELKLNKDVLETMNVETFSSSAVVTRASDFFKFKKVFEKLTGKSLKNRICMKQKMSNNKHQCENHSSIKKSELNVREPNEEKLLPLKTTSIPGNFNHKLIHTTNSKHNPLYEPEYSASEINRIKIIKKPQKLTMAEKKHRESYFSGRNRDTYKHSIENNDLDYNFFGKRQSTSWSDMSREGVFYRAMLRFKNENKGNKQARIIAKKDVPENYVLNSIFDDVNVSEVSDWLKSGSIKYNNDNWSASPNYSEFNTRVSGNSKPNIRVKPKTLLKSELLKSKFSKSKTCTSTKLMLPKDKKTSKRMKGGRLANDNEKFEKTKVSILHRSKDGEIQQKLSYTSLNKEDVSEQNLNEYHIQPQENNSNSINLSDLSLTSSNLLKIIKENLMTGSTFTSEDPPCSPSESLNLKSSHNKHSETTFQSKNLNQARSKGGGNKNEFEDNMSMLNLKQPDSKDLMWSCSEYSGTGSKIEEDSYFGRKPSDSSTWEYEEGSIRPFSRSEASSRIQLQSQIPSQSGLQPEGGLKTRLQSLIPSQSILQSKAGSQKRTRSRGGRKPFDSSNLEHGEGLVRSLSRSKASSEIQLRSLLQSKAGSKKRTRSRGGSSATHLSVVDANLSTKMSHQPYNNQVIQPPYQSEKPISYRGVDNQRSAKTSITQNLVGPFTEGIHSENATQISKTNTNHQSLLPPEKSEVVIEIQNPSNISKFITQSQSQMPNYIQNHIASDSRSLGGELVDNLLTTGQLSREKSTVKSRPCSLRSIIQDDPQSTARSQPSDIFMKTPESVSSWDCSDQLSRASMLTNFNSDHGKSAWNSSVSDIFIPSVISTRSKAVEEFEFQDRQQGGCCGLVQARSQSAYEIRRPCKSQCRSELLNVSQQNIPCERKCNLSLSQQEPILNMPSEHHVEELVNVSQQNIPSERECPLSHFQQEPILNMPSEHHKELLNVSQQNPPREQECLLSLLQHEPMLNMPEESHLKDVARNRSQMSICSQNRQEPSTKPLGGEIVSTPLQFSTEKSRQIFDPSLQTNEVCGEKVTVGLFDNTLPTRTAPCSLRSTKRADAQGSAKSLPSDIFMMPHKSISSWECSDQLSAGSYIMNFGSDHDKSAWNSSVSDIFMPSVISTRSKAVEEFEFQDRQQGGCCGLVQARSQSAYEIQPEPLDNVNSGEILEIPPEGNEDLVEENILEPSKSVQSLSSGYSRLSDIFINTPKSVISWTCSDQISQKSRLRSLCSNVVIPSADSSTHSKAIEDFEFGGQQGGYCGSVQQNILFEPKSNQNILSKSLTKSKTELPEFKIGMSVNSIEKTETKTANPQQKHLELENNDEFLNGERPVSNWSIISSDESVEEIQKNIHETPSLIDFYSDHEGAVWNDDASDMYIPPLVNDSENSGIVNANTINMAVNTNKKN